MVAASPGRASPPGLELLAEPTRRLIVALLAERPRRPTSLREAIGVSQATLAFHLGILRRAGIVLDSRVLRDGRVRLYMLHPRRARAVMAWLATSGLADEDSRTRPVPAGTWPKRVYAVELGSIRIAVTGGEVRSLSLHEAVVALPLAAHGVVGVVEVGPHVVPVLDLAGRLGIASDGDLGHARGWLLVEGRDGPIAVRAAAATDLGFIERSDVRLVPRSVLANGADSVIGFVRVSGQLIALVDLGLM
jgi:DNA-binding transcriptional ArsR family regulator